MPDNRRYLVSLRLIAAMAALTLSGVSKSACQPIARRPVLGLDRVLLGDCNRCGIFTRKRASARMPWYRSGTGHAPASNGRRIASKSMIMGFTLCTFCAGCDIERPIFMSNLEMMLPVKMIDISASSWENTRPPTNLAVAFVCLPPQETVPCQIIFQPDPEIAQATAFTAKYMPFEH